MQERLLQLGAWLAVNGEAIYGSRRYTSEKEDGVYYTKNNGCVYAMLAHFPFGSVTLKHVAYSPALKAELLGSDAPLLCSDDGGCLRVSFPALNPESVASHCFYTLKIR